MRRREASEQAESDELRSPEVVESLQFSSIQVDSISTTPKLKCLPLTTTKCGKAYTCLINCKTPKDSLLRKMGAEFVGTFMLVFTAVAGPIVNQKYNGIETLIGNAACAGLAVLMAVLSTGHISGAHLNPSVSIAFAALRQFPWAHVPGYILAQLLAALSASLALKGIFDSNMSAGVTAPAQNVGIGQAFALEFVITFHLLFVITAVAKDSRSEGEFAGVAIGAAVLVNILVAGPLTGASMNPARTLGPAIVAGSYKAIWLYMAAPPLGAIAGVAVYITVKLQDDETEPES